MTSKKKKAGQQRRGLEATSKSSESRHTENSSCSISSPLPRSTATSTLPSSSHSSSHSSASNIRSSCEAQSRSGSQTQSRARPQAQFHPASQAHPHSRPGSQAHSHPTSSARPPSSSSSSTSQPPSSTRPCTACCTGPCCSGVKSSSSSSRSRGRRPVSPNFLLPSIPPPSRRRPRTMPKNKLGSSSRQKAKATPDAMAKSVDPKDEKNLRAKHPLAKLRTMELKPGDWLGKAYPFALRPLIETPIIESVRVVYTDKAQFYLLMKKLIDDVKNGATQLHMIIFKPIPMSMIHNDIVWDYNVAPHCRFTYLEAQATLILKIVMETRMMEFFPRTELNFDDTDMGVQGHALGRFKYGLKKQLSAMGIVEEHWEFACCKTRRSHGLVFDIEDPVENKSTHSADRMFIPKIISNPKYDADHKPWPTMVIEIGPGCLNMASRFYQEYSVDWWFSQSEGFTKVVILMMFDYERHFTAIEKWVCAPEAPFTKKLAQHITVTPKRDDKGKPIVIVEGEDLVLDFESLMARPKREGESDIVFDKDFMSGFGNGFFLTWRNVGTSREHNFKSTGIDLETARKLLNDPFASLKLQLGSALPKDEAAEEAK